MSDIIVWSSGEPAGPSVAIRVLGQRTLIVLHDGRGRTMAVTPPTGAMLASGIDEALKRIDRRGNLRITAPVGSAEMAAPQALPGSGRIGETE